MTQTLDLKLDSDDDHPRRLVAFPCGHVLALGGDDSTLSCITSDDKKKDFSVRILRQYDEAALRSIAVSTDGKRVAIGFDNGSTTVYHYDDYNGTEGHHPFIPAPKATNNDEDEEAENGFLSQPDMGDEEDDAIDRAWAGPQVQGPVRDLKFLPNSHYLAVASESGLLVVNVSSAETITDRFLEAQTEKEHDGGGVRGVSISQNELQLMASLSMEGRLCLWKLGGMDKLESASNIVPYLREAKCCVPKKDIGELIGADAWDRSCLPHWVKPDVLALPGKTHLQLKEVSYVNESILVDESKAIENSDPSKGHIEPIVALASQGNYIVSSGRDGRVILWQLEEDEEGLPIAGFVELLGQFDSTPTSICWNGKTLLMGCANGSLEIATDLVPKPVKKEAKQEATEEPANKDTKTTEVPASKTKQKKSFEDGSKTTAKSATKIPSEKTKRPKITFAEAEDEEGSDNDKDNLKSSTKSLKTHKNDSGKPAIDSDDDHDSLAPETQAPFQTKANSNGSDDDLPLSPSPKKKSSDNQADSDEDINAGPSKLEEHGNKMDVDENQNDEKASCEKDEEEKPRGKKGMAINAKLQSSESEDITLKTEKLKLPLKQRGSTVNGDSDDSDDDDVKALEEESDDELSFKKKRESSKDKHTKSKNHLSSKKSNAKRLVKHSKPTVDDDSDEDEDLFDAEENKSTKKSPGTSKVSFIDDEAEDSNEIEEENKDKMVDAPAQVPQKPKDSSDASFSTDVVAEIDDKEKGFPIDNDDDDDSRADDVADNTENFGQSARYTSGPVLPEPQAAFAPSSSPLDLSRRFLCWNNIGSITLINDEMGQRSSVDINFTDKAFRRPVSFTDNQGFILGSLGDDGAIFATDLADDEDDLDDGEDDLTEGLSLSARTKAALRKSQKQRMQKGSTPQGSSIYFHRFETFASLKDKDWYLTLPDGERVLGCACGRGWAAAVTSRKFLRLFTSGGAQDQILWLPGNPVTIVGRERFLAVFYHESMPLVDGTQKLGYMLYDAVASKTICKGPVCCIASGCSLSWVGFSNDCSLMAMDSDGMLSMLIATSLPTSVGDENGDSNLQPASWEWAPLLDTVGLRKSSDDIFWPITVFDGKLVCIPLKGGKQYPDATRRPTTATVGMKMPLARSAAAKSFILEELSVRSKMALTQKKVNNDIACGELMGDDFEEEYRTMCAQVDKVSLKLFATTVEAGKLERALDLVDRFHLEKSYDLAMEIAKSHTKLVDYIEEAKETKFPPEEDDVEDYEQEEDYEEPNNNSGVNYGGANSSPPKNQFPSSRRISPSSASKRGFSGPQPERNVRARAF